MEKNLENIGAFLKDNKLGMRQIRNEATCQNLDTKEAKATKKLKMVSHFRNFITGGCVLIYLLFLLRIFLK